MHSWPLATVLTSRVGLQVSVLFDFGLENVAFKNYKAYSQC
jgi:hypothetical protein